MDSLKFVTEITFTPEIVPNANAPPNETSNSTRLASQAGFQNPQPNKLAKRTWTRDMLIGDGGVQELETYLYQRLGDRENVTSVNNLHKGMDPEQYV